MSTPSASTRTIPSTAQLANRIRLHALDMISRSGSSHIGGVFSMAEIIAVLYDGILDISPETCESPDRDRFVLSKGHATAGLYAVLAEKGFFPIDWLESYAVDGAKLSSHVSSGVPGVEVSSGSLGHGLSMGAGFALAGKTDGRKYRTFVLLGDGECDEGSVWEAALFAAHHRLDNLVAIVDYNKIQAFGNVADVMGLEPFADKWTAFGWETREVDGHDLEILRQVLSSVPLAEKKPTCLIAHTVKGKGVACMENKLLWHYRTPREEEYETARRDLERGT